MPGFRTDNPAFRQMLRVAERAAGSSASVLITGESGTGKNRLARFLHERSARRGGPFVEVACANLPHELLESELFGHERGAFTGAHQERPGRFEQAHRGTLFLDELSELAPELQAKVLRAIDEKRFERLGGQRTREVDVRIVASTRHDPERLVQERRLREDLFYRLNVVHLQLPTLRERVEDIPVLAGEFLAEAVGRHRLGTRHFDADVLERFARYPWPGNVRELWHVVESVAILSTNERITVADLPAQLSSAGVTMLGAAADEGVSLAELERAYIDEVLQRTGGNKSAAARILGIHRKTLHEKLRARTDAR